MSALTTPSLTVIDGPHGRLAARVLPGRGPTVVFLPGLQSDMAGAKAEALAAWCAARGQACLRLDYSGHGQSEGRFIDGTISAWRDDALAVIDALSDGKLLLVGSSMGGWIALLTALARRARVMGLIGVAPAPDFTENLFHARMSADQRATLMRDGVLTVPNDYGLTMQITRALIEDGRRNLLLNAPIPLDIPVRLIHGQRDTDVDWRHSLRIAEAIEGSDVHVTLVKDGEHRLSRPADLALLVGAVEGVLGGGEGRKEGGGSAPRPRWGQGTPDPMTLERARHNVLVLKVMGFGVP